MKKIKIIYIIGLIIFIFLLFTYVLNRIFIFRYNRKNYDEKAIAKVMLLRPLSCVSHYNYGNYYYNKEMYDEAIDKYEKALKLFPSEKKECSIRINLALAKLKKIDFDAIKTEDDIQNTITELEKIKEILLEKGCANRYDNNGHSKEAEKLKKEIEDLIEKLKNASSKSYDDKEDEDENEENKDDQKTENSKERQLEELKAESMETRNDKMDFRIRSNQTGFYRGKKW